jgi:cell division protein FtsZ
VVATGIDAVAGVQPSAGPENRIAQLTQKLRADGQRIAQREAAQAPSMVRAAPSPIPESIESAAHAAVAAALASQVSSVEDVTIRPIPPKPSLFQDAIGATDQTPVAEAPPAPTFIPPAAERPRHPRMPRIDELPIPGQNEMRARQGLPTETEHPEKRRMSLLQRLAAVGLGRREEGDEPAVMQPVQRPVPQMTERPRPAPWPAPAESAAPVSEYARRPAPQGLDQHGRQAAVHNAPDDDQLDIPAFLRRQAN